MVVTTTVRLLAVAVALAACQSQQAAAAPPEYNLNEVFALGGGQQASIRGENLSLRFTDVLEDSRCPTAVDCVWTGQARIAVEVQPQGSAPTVTEFNTNAAPGQRLQTTRVGAYTIELQSLAPYPETTEPIAFEDYRATLLVTKP
jgi:hypothetical protein